MSFAITVILEHGQKQTERGCADGDGQRHGAEHSGSAADAGQCRRGQRHGRRRQQCHGRRRRRRGGDTWSSSARPGRRRGHISVKAYDSSVIRQPGCGQVDLSYFSDARVPRRQPDGRLFGLQHQPGRGAHLRLHRRWPGCHRQPERCQEQCARAGSGAGCAGSRAAQEAVYPAGHQHPDHAWGRQTASSPITARCWTSCGRRWGSDVRRSMCSPSRRYGRKPRPKSRASPSDVLRSVNEQLAQLAAQKGCVYLDLWERYGRR